MSIYKFYEVIKTKTLSIVKPQKKTINLQLLSKEWLKMNEHSFKQSTYSSYEYIINKYILDNEIAQIAIRDLERLDFVSFSDTLLSKGLSSKMVNDILIVMNQVMKYAANEYSTKLFSLPYVKETKKEMRVLSIAEQQTLEQCLNYNMDIYKLGIFFSLYTGIRIGELCALKWEDISNGIVSINKTMYRLRDNKGNSQIVIGPPKTNSSTRTIPIPDFLVHITEQFRLGDEYHFLSDSRKTSVEPRLMQIHFKKIARECCLENVTFHTLRHTFATRCVECDFDIKTLSEILGHSDVKTTLNKYVHSSMELKQRNMNKLALLAI